MKKLLLLRKWLLMTFLAILPQLALAETVNVRVDDISYTIDTASGEAEVSTLSSSSTQKNNLVIPDYITYNGQKYPVTSIRNYAFRSNTRLTGSLTIGNSVRTIGEQAFYRCTGLNGTLTIGNSVESIGDEAFYECALTGSVTIPNSVRTIGEKVFYNCTGLNGSLTIGNSVETIGKGAFERCSNLTGSLSIPNSVKTIGDGAFLSCSQLNGTLTIGNSVETIEIWAFCGCEKLSGSLSIPNSVKTIDSYAFAQCSGLTGSLTIGNSVRTIGKEAFYECSGLTGPLTIGNSVETIGRLAFCDCSKLTGSLIIPNSVKTIGVAAFMNCSQLNGTFTIGNSVVTIGESAFSGCSGLTGSLTLPSSVETIGESAFNSCSGLTGSLIIPNSVKIIERSAFNSCSGLNGSLTLPSSVVTIGDSAFNKCAKLTGPLTVPNSVKTIGGNAFYDCSGLTGPLTIGNSVEIIGFNAFANCSGLSGQLIIPNSVTAIEDCAFFGCTGFVGPLTLGKSIETIGAGAFENCSGLTGSLTIPASVVTVGERAFCGCTGLSGQLILGNSVETIGECAFSKCNGFSEIYLPASLKNIGTYAFFSGYNYEYPDKITKVTCEATIPPKIGDNYVGYEAFCGITCNNAKLIVPKESIDLYKKAFNWMDFKNIEGIKPTTEAGSISLNKTEAKLKATETVQLVATVLPETTTDKSVAWSTSNPAVATVSVNGLVTALAAGEATVTATTTNGLTATCRITVIARETPQISVKRSDELVVLIDGERTTLWVEPTGGNANGWSYKWTLGGSAVGTSRELTVTGHSNGADASSVDYAVNVSNTMDGAVIYDETFLFTVETYPKPANTTATSVSATKIRQGNTLTLSADEPEGGYSDWRYEWSLNGRELSADLTCVTVVEMAPGKEQATEEQRFDFRATNFGPDGAQWGSIAEKAEAVKVYRRPQTPAELLRKGNGTTHTLVIMAGMSDSEISRLGYEFVYGYTDADGRDHEVAQTALRYCQMDSRVFNDPTCEKWCYALWRYADGSTVSSGRRYLDGTADESFDASDFSNSRQAGLNDVEAGTIRIEQLRESVVVTAEATSATRIELYSLSGHLVLRREIEGSTYGRVSISANDVAPGLYLLKVGNQQEQTVKKIAIK